MAIIHPNFQTIRGYELRERIGAGGFGVVYRAYQSAVDREVAIKVILPEYANHPDFIRGFESEARLIARLEHLHIVPLYDYWREPDGAYLVMRWLTGGNLRQSLQESPWEPQRASRMLDQIASALALAHRRGVVHRDLKPENILLDEAGNAYLSDFGVAKDLFQSTQLTETGALKGSFAFISPEQVQGEAISPQSDLYSLGIVMFELLTGQHPFAGETPTAQLFKHVSEPVPSIHELRPDLPEGLDDVIQTVTAKQPMERYPGALAFAAAFRDALKGARIEIPTPETLLVTAEPVNPYKGLRAFEEVDALDFFGREATVEELLARMSEEGDDTRFLAVVGPSGSGKSSLVKAGLIPALGRGELPGSENWFVVDMLPGSHPLDELEVALTRVAAEQGANLSEHLHRDERGLLRAAGLILPDDDSELVVIVDQFEETFTLVEDEARRAQFLDLLHAAVRDPRSRVRVVVTLRADFYDRPLQYPGIAELVQGRTETVLPLSAEELERAIVKPAERVGVKYEQGLVASIVGEVHYQPGALPLLQYALTELFEERDGRLLSHEAYESIGRAVGALASRAEATYAEMDEDGQEAVKQMYLRLVTLGEGVEDTRRRVERAELLAVAADPELMNQVIDTFAAYRLLSLDHDPATRRPTVEVAHEALLREWDRLREWLDESRADIRLQRQLARAANEWSEAEGDSSFLLRGARLEQFETWRRITGLALTQLEEDYLKASLDAESKRLQREAQQERLRRNLQRALIAVLSVGLIVAVGLSIFAFGQQRIANQRREEAQVQAAILLAAQAESELREGYSDRAVLLALEALENYPYTPQAEHALGQAVSYNRALQGHMGHSGAVTSAAWSPDGRRVATSSTDNSVHVWDAASGEELLVIDLPEGITGNIYDYALTVKWSPDGEHLLTMSGDRFLLGSQDYDLMLWDAAPAAEGGVVDEPLMAIELPNQAEPEEGEGSITTFGVHYVTGAAADFSPQSGRLATIAGDDTAIIWDADLQEGELVLRGHENDVNSVDWSPDDMRLLTASEDGTARIWDARNGETLLVLEGHEGAVNAALFSPDGTQLATASDDGTVRIWDAALGDEGGETGETLQTLEPQAGVVSSLAWSPDGSYLATGTDDGRIRVWSIASGEVIAELAGHNDFVAHLAWSPAGDRLASAGADGLARLWNAAPSTAAQTLPYLTVADPSWSSDGRYLALPAGDLFDITGEPGRLAIWDVAAGQAVTDKLDREFDYSWFEADYSPDDSLILVKGLTCWQPQPECLAEIETIHALDAQTGKEVRSFTVTDGSWIRSCGWSPDGTQVAGGTIEGTLYVWDFQTGQLLHTIETHESWINALEYSPDGTKIATAGVTAQVWDAETGDRLLLLAHEAPNDVWSAIWSPDGTKLLTTSGYDDIGTKDNTIRIWNAETGEELLVLRGHARQITLATWSPDGRRIASTSSDSTTRVWDAETGDELLTLSTPAIYAPYARWSPDGKYVAVTEEASPTEIWRVWQSAEELIEYAHDCCVWRELTDAERQQFGLPEAP